MNTDCRPEAIIYPTVVGPIIEASRSHAVAVPTRQRANPSRIKFGRVKIDPEIDRTHEEIRNRDVDQNLFGGRIARSSTSINSAAAAPTERHGEQRLSPDIVDE